MTPNYDLTVHVSFFLDTEIYIRKLSQTDKKNLSYNCLTLFHVVVLLPITDNDTFNDNSSSTHRIDLKLSGKLQNDKI